MKPTKKLCTEHELLSSLKKLLNKVSIGDIVFVCIGTDRSTGDSLGPLVGHYLKLYGFDNVYGTVDDPVHALNLQETLEKIPKDKRIIAIDSCLGAMSSVGKFIVGNVPLHPGAGVGKEIPPVGDYSIAGIVNVGGFMEYFVLQNTRLSLVMKMANVISESIISVFATKLEVAVSKEE